MYKFDIFIINYIIITIVIIICNYYVITDFSHTSTQLPSSPDSCNSIACVHFLPPDVNANTENYRNFGQNKLAQAAQHHN